MCYTYRPKFPTRLRGDNMLGYTLDDLDKMTACVNLSQHYIPDNSSNDELRAGLEMASTFLQGLWAEGYFE